MNRAFACQNSAYNRATKFPFENQAKPESERKEAMHTAASEKSDPITESRNIWTEAAKAGDAPRIASIFCDDVVLMPPNETSLYGKSEAMEWWEEYFDHFKV